MATTHPLQVFLPDTRGVVLSRYGSGNAKIGFGVFTYSRHPGQSLGTCPGSSSYCESKCYAKRIGGIVARVYDLNMLDDVPPIPTEARLLRIHVSGDFDSVPYIQHWIERLRERPDVIAWAYTRSWRVPELQPSLEVLRALPNMQLFASMDASMSDLPPAGWRRAWIQTPDETRLRAHGRVTRALDAPAYVCPEETGAKPNCVACAYCFEGQKHDVIFLEH